MNILLISGATRPNNNTARAVKLVQKYFASAHPDIALKIVSPNDFKIEFDDHSDQDPRYTQLVNEANAFIILSPEYNHGYPGRLKSLLDSTYKGYNYKHVLIGGVSDGPFGGARMIENLSSVLKCFRMYMNKDDLIFPNVDKILDLDGNDSDSEHFTRITKTIDDFVSRVSDANIQ